MFLGIALRPALPRLAKSLQHVRLSDLVTPADQPVSDGFIGDLGVDDQIALQNCSRGFWVRQSHVRCRVSLWQREPPCIQGRFYRGLPWMGRRFDRVLTYDRELLRTLPNAAFVAHGGCWIESPGDHGHVPKTNNLSIIASPKCSTSGQRLRHDVIRWTRDQGIDHTAFGHSYTPLSDKAQALDPFRFSVVVENMQSSNYFTEKLIDCFVCGCVPIYWGTADIGNFFDPDGMMICRTREDVLHAIESAGVDEYQSRLEALTANRHRAMRFVDYHDHVFDALRGYARIRTSPRSPQSIDSAFRQSRVAVAC